MQSGKKVCKAIEDYLRSRAKCEEEYTKRLLRCVSDVHTDASTGTLKKSLDALLGGVDEAAKLHSEMSNAYNRAAQQIAQLREKHRVEIDQVSTFRRARNPER